MTRGVAITLAASLLVGVGVYLYAWAGPDTAVVEEAAIAAPAPLVTTAPRLSVEPPPVVVAAPLDFVAGMNSTDAKTRAATIVALGNAPRDVALPLLKNVLRSGDTATERPLALTSLESLARRDGDADGAIRDTVRQAVYHSDDTDFSQLAQTRLDDIEHALVAR